MIVEKCPVCGGNGLVPNGFYTQTLGRWLTSSTGGETCRSCGGKGYVVIPNSEDQAILWEKLEEIVKEALREKGNIED